MANTPDILRCVLRLWLIADQQEFQATVNNYEFVWLNDAQVGKIFILCINSDCGNWYKVDIDLNYTNYNNDLLRQRENKKKLPFISHQSFASSVSSYF